MHSRLADRGDGRLAPILARPRPATPPEVNQSPGAPPSRRRRAVDGWPLPAGESGAGYGMIAEACRQFLLTRLRDHETDGHAVAGPAPGGELGWSGAAD